MQKIKLFCLPYAGGTAMIYSSWKKNLHSEIELFPIELAGRGKRCKEPFYSNVYEAVDDIYNAIKDELDGTSFAFYGHSMGTVLVYELIYKIKELMNLEPVYAFFSGRYPPQVKKTEKFCYKMPENEFIQEIRSLGGTPEEFFENRELMEIFLPILRADYMLIELYNHAPKPGKLGMGITVFNGKQDKYVTHDDLEEWQYITSGKNEVIEFDGGHFFIFDNQKEIISVINDKLLTVSL